MRICAKHRTFRIPHSAFRIQKLRITHYAFRIEKTPANKPCSVYDNHLSCFYVTVKFSAACDGPSKPCIAACRVALLRIGFTGALCYHKARWALTSPFHPWLCSFEPSPVYLCCTLPGVTSGGRYPLSCSVKHGLSSLRHFCLLRDCLDGYVQVL